MGQNLMSFLCCSSVSGETEELLKFFRKIQDWYFQNIRGITIKSFSEYYFISGFWPGQKNPINSDCISKKKNSNKFTNLISFVAISYPVRMKVLTKLIRFVLPQRYLHFKIPSYVYNKFFKNGYYIQKDIRLYEQLKLFQNSIFHCGKNTSPFL